jgi:hypothetical protein
LQPSRRPPKKTDAVLYKKYGSDVAGPVTAALESEYLIVISAFVYARQSESAAAQQSPTI